MTNLPRFTLALDCSFGGLSLGLFDNGKELTSFEQPETRSTTNLAPMLENIFASTATSAHDIETVVVTVGPGSFTGIRLGLAVAEALKVVNPAIHIVGLSTLQAVAAMFRSENKPQTVLLDAAGGMAYQQSFSPDLTPTTTESCTRLEDAVLPAENALRTGPGLLLERASTLVSTIPPHTLVELAQNPTNHKPALPHYVKPLTYKPQHA